MEPILNGDWEHIRAPNMYHPNQVITDKEGRVWLASYGGILFSKDNGSTWQQTPPPCAGIENIISISFDKETSTFFLTDYGNGCDGGKILYTKKPLDPTSWMFFKKPERKGIKPLRKPTCATSVSDNCVWVADYGNDRILKTPDFGETWHLVHDVSSPTYVLEDSNKVIWIVTNNNAPLLTTTNNGKTLDAIASVGRGHGEFYHPSTVYEDSVGRLWVADYGNGRIQFSMNRGKTWNVVGEQDFDFERFKPGMFAYPSSITESRSYLLVTDPKKNNLQRINLTVHPRVG